MPRFLFCRHLASQLDPKTFKPVITLWFSFEFALSRGKSKNNNLLKRLQMELRSKQKYENKVSRQVIFIEKNIKISSIMSITIRFFLHINLDCFCHG